MNLYKLFERAVENGLDALQRYSIIPSSKYKTKSKIDWNYYISHKYDDEVKSAVYDYVSGLTTAVNDFLRAGKDKVAKPITDVLDLAFTERRVIDVWRTVDWQYMYNVYGLTPFNLDEHVGTEFVSLGYMSTSMIKKSPWGNKWSVSEVILHIISEEAYPCIDINEMFTADEIDCSEQKEILLPRSTKMKLTGYIAPDKHVGNFILTLNIIN